MRLPTNLDQLKRGDSFASVGQISGLSCPRTTVVKAACNYSDQQTGSCSQLLAGFHGVTRADERQNLQPWINVVPPSDRAHSICCAGLQLVCTKPLLIC